MTLALDYEVGGDTHAHLHAARLEFLDVLGVSCDRGLMPLHIVHVFVGLFQKKWLTDTDNRAGKRVLQITRLVLEEIKISREETHSLFNIVLRIDLTDIISDGLRTEYYGTYLELNKAHTFQNRYLIPCYLVLLGDNFHLFEEWRSNV